jgi:uncharacterized protein (DUF2249 family)
MFDDLEPGESFVLHNNEDYPQTYQLLKERYGNMFTMEYLRSVHNGGIS